MKLERVRIRGRFVYGDRAGVWQKVSWDKTRCIYGRDYGTEVDVQPGIPVYVIFENKFNRFGSRDEYDRRPDGDHRYSEQRESAGSQPQAIIMSQDVCSKCGGLLTGKPPTCPSCGVSVSEAPTLSVDAKAIVVPSPEIKKGDSPNSESRKDNNMKIVVMDDEGKKVYDEILDATAADVVAMTSADSIKMKLDGVKAEVSIEESYYDFDEKVLYILVRKQE